MANYNDQLLDIVRKYRASGNEWPASKRQIALWAMTNNLWKPHHSAMLNQLANELGKAMREEYFTDPQGRDVRAKHVAPFKKEGGEEEEFRWGDMRDRDTDFMETSLQHRRGLILRDCRQLKIDQDSFNQNYNDGAQIQLSFDFTLDVLEMELANLAKLN